jgi:signal transduction histidine kinase
MVTSGSGWIGRFAVSPATLAVTSVQAPHFVLRAGTEVTAAAGVHTVAMTYDRRRVAWGLVVLSAALTTVALVIAIGDGLGWDELLNGDPGREALMALTFPVLGALLLARTPENRLAWVFLAAGVSRGLGMLTQHWASHEYQTNAGWPLADEMAFISVAMTFVAPLLAPLIVLWFPDGRLPDERARWRWAQRLLFVAAAGLLVFLSQAWELRGPRLVDDSPIPGGLIVVGLAVFVAGTVAGVLAGFAAVWSRLRGQDRVVAQQVKWYLAGAVAALALNLAGDFLPDVGFLNLVGTLAFEAAILVAVRRHGLWDIDRILNRTVVYGLLTATLAAVYIGTVLGLGLLLGELSLGRSISVAAATLAAAIIAAPARRELQRRVDRRFDRRTYDAVQRITRYADEATLAPPAPGELEQLLRDVLRDAELQLLFRCGDGTLVDAGGTTAAEPGAAATSIGGPAGELGLIVHRTFPAYEQVLFASVGRAAVRAIALTRLHAELLVQVRVVEQSRRRIVGAADAERRRVERDLHDGAQQRLVALGMKLRSEQRRHAGDLGPQADQIIDLSVSEILGSVEDLRALAGGLLPGSLVSEGLGAALGELVDRQPDPVQCRQRLDHRHAPEIEATAWFVAAEGLANSLKHAPGSCISIEASCDGDRLQITVRDDGPGGATDGPGLTGLEDRVRACAGTLDVDSPPRAGTQLTAVLPCV